jgi:hypothetical protein
MHGLNRSFALTAGDIDGFHSGDNLAPRKPCFSQHIHADAGWYVHFRTVSSGRATRFEFFHLHLKLTLRLPFNRKGRTLITSGVVTTRKERNHDNEKE